MATVVTAPTAAEADPWSDLQHVVQRVRAGDLDGVEAKLGQLGTRGPRLARAAANFILARVHARSGNSAKAREAFGRARAIRRISKPAWLWAEVEILIAEDKDREALTRLGALRQEFPKFRWAAADLLYSRLQEPIEQPEKVAQTALALYRKSHLYLPQDELLARAARMTDRAAPTRAIALWRQLVMKHPESPLAGEALRHIGGPSALSDEDRLARAELLFARRAYEACRVEAQALWASGYRREVVGYLLGKIGSERLRDEYVEAEGHLRAAAKEGAPYAMQAQSSLGILLGKRGRPDEAVAAFDTWLKRYPDAPIKRRVEAHYDRGRALHMAGRSLEAAAGLKAFLDEHRRGFDHPKYQWFVGFWTFRAGRFQDAIDLMKPLLSEPNPLVGGKAMYWTARALEELGQKRPAVDMLVKLLRRMPLTYYAGLAELRLQEWGAARRIPRRRSMWRHRPRPSDPYAGLAASPGLTRLRVAAHLGEPDVARRVLKVVRPRLVRSYGEARVVALEAALADPLERFYEARRAARRGAGRTLRAYPSRRTLPTWHAAYPRAYATHASHAAQRAGIPEWLVYSHMLQESRYNPNAISGAPAYGLMQLLDRTAVRLASEGEEDYQLWMAMEPSYNVRWGARYLGALVRKFGGQLPFAIASYNGGPMLLEAHMTRAEGLPFDVMIDDLGTHESRNYVRRVIEHVLRYLVLYESPRRARTVRKALLPASWQKAWLEHPDY